MNDPRFPEHAWFKSGPSGTVGCVEVNLAAVDNDLIGVRDSKNKTGPVLVFNKFEWGAFLSGAKTGEFDLNP